MTDRKTILIVDDTPDNLSLLSSLLKSVYKTKIATNGQKALAIASSDNPPDLVLLDIMMPEIDGYEVCRRLKAGETTRDIPIIFLTAMSQAEDEQKGLEIGAVDYITKPINPSLLLARVNTHLRLKEANDFLKNQTEILEQKVQERTRQLSLTNEALTKFVPNELLHALGQDNILDVKLGDHMYGEMTIMFSDIRSYTTLSETMTPQEVFNFTNGFHNRMAPIIRYHHGFVQQFQGDGVLSVFPKNPDDGLQSAIAILEKCEAYNQERIPKKRYPIQLGIGLHSGALMVGILGDSERWEAGVPSDTVNTAARMEGLTKYYGVSIVLSETAFAGLSDPEHYHYRFLDNVQVKGKLQPLSIYEVFDADQAEQFEKKLATKSTFEQGQQHYFAKEFADAVKCFTDVLMELPADVTTRHYLQRSSACLLDGVPDNWQGVRTMDKK
jgi:DNA-binding response OmpR family regulator